MSRYYLRYTLSKLCLMWLVGLSCWQCHTAELAPDVLPHSILAVSLENTAVLSSVFDSTSHTWTLGVAYLTNLHALKPTLTLAGDVSVVPRSGEVQDFTKPVYYIVTTATGAKTAYKIVVKSAVQPTPQITSASVDTLEAGQLLRLTGHSFGSFSPDVQVVATSPNNLTTLLTATLLDSTHVQVVFPFTLAPGQYGLQVLVRNLPSMNKQTVQIQYPSPQLVALNRQYLRGGDTLQVNGLYIKPNSYQYALRVDNGKQNQLLESILPGENGFRARLDPTLPAGRYRVQILNRSEHKLSRDTTFSIQLYDRNKPFVTGVLSPKSSYASGESVVLKTVNFSAVSTRFYQLQLSSSRTSYVVNGIYDTVQQQLTLNLPAHADKGRYALSVRMLDTTGGLLYSFDTDESFTLP